MSWSQQGNTTAARSRRLRELSRCDHARGPHDCHQSVTNGLWGGPWTVAGATSRNDKSHDFSWLFSPFFVVAGACNQRYLQLWSGAA